MTTKGPCKLQGLFGFALDFSFFCLFIVMEAQQKIDILQQLKSGELMRSFDLAKSEIAAYLQSTEVKLMKKKDRIEYTYGIALYEPDFGKYRFKFFTGDPDNFYVAKFDDFSFFNTYTTKNDFVKTKVNKFSIDLFEDEILFL